MNYRYLFTILDANGNAITQYDLTAEQAMSLILERLTEKSDEAPHPASPKLNEGKGRPNSNRKCGHCGNSGHTVVTCPENKRGHPNNAKPKKNQSTRRYATKPCCGSTGPRHKKGCTASHFEKEPTKNGGKRLTEDEYDNLIHLKTIGDLNTKQFAEDNDIPISEVNRAIFAKDYEDYLAF